MKAEIKYLFILILAGCSSLNSCKKHEVTSKNNLVDPNPEEAQNPSAYRPAKLTSGKSVILFNYNKAAALYKVDYGDGDSTLLKFNSSGKPVELSRYENGKMNSTTYYSRDQSGNITKAQIYLVSGNDELKSGSYQIAYSADGKISSVNYYDKDNRMVEEQLYTYTTAGNLSAQKSALLNAQYAYDEKNGLFKNAGYAWLFAVEDEGALFLSGVNNIAQCSFPLASGNNQTLNYTYNSAGYPVSITSTRSGLTTTTKITYQ
jgi:YD repeat-containing protein